MTPPPARVVIVRPGEAEPGRDRLLLAVTRAGTAARLAAPPIHARRPLEAQAFTGLGAGATGIFDDWRPDAYGATQVPAGPILPRSVQETARRSDMTVVECPHVSGGARGHGIYHVTDAVALDGVTEATKTLTTLWLQPCVREPAHTVLNPVALLVEAGLLEVDRCGRPDWTRSLAYHVGHGQIWVNLRGREPHGIVQPGSEYDEVRAALRALVVERLVDPATGEPLVQVFVKENLYSGEWLWAAPDLVLSPGPDRGFSAVAMAGHPETESVRREEAVATRPGWWGVTGWGARHQGEGPATDILRLAPTIAAVLGLSLVPPPPGAMVPDGLTEEFWATRPVVPTSTAVLSADEERIIARRLGELGYIE